MKLRRTPRTVPQKSHYLTLEIEGIGNTSWRIPSLVKAARVLNMLQKSGILDAAAEAENGSEILANLGDNLSSFLAAQGALLGICWFDCKEDLETPPPKQKTDLMEYGEEVYEEMHEAGWQLGQVTEVFVALTESVTEAFITQKDVAERVDFLNAEKGKPN